LEGRFGMSSKWRGWSAAVIGVATLISLDTARAADANFCGNYATAAMRQIEIVQRNPNCANRVGGPRWVPDFNVHYNWCLGQPYWAANGERDRRREFVDRCTHGG
jgi:hypothetical protein